MAYGTDKEEKIYLNYQKSEFSKPVMYIFNFKKNEVLVNGEKGTVEDLKELKRLIDYFGENAEALGVETILIPKQEKEG